MDTDRHGRSDLSLASQWNALFPPPSTNEERKQAKLDQRYERRRPGGSPLQDLGTRLYRDRLDAPDLDLAAAIARAPAPLIALALEDVFVRSRVASARSPSSRQRKKVRWLHGWQRSLHAGLVEASTILPWQDTQRLYYARPSVSSSCKIAQALSWIVLSRHGNEWVGQWRRHDTVGDRAFAPQRMDTIRILIDKMIVRPIDRHMNGGYPSSGTPGREVDLLDDALEQAIAKGTWHDASCLWSEGNDVALSGDDPILVPICLTVKRDTADRLRHQTSVDARVLSPIYQRRSLTDPAP